MENEFIPTLTHATERDIDLLLVEELHATHEFVLWVAATAKFEQPIASWDVKHSKRRTRSRREIDIFLEIEHVGGRRVALLVENKLDAGEQPDQAESYRKELEVLDNDYDDAAMIIVCPAEYSQRHQDFTSKFDAEISYESLRGWFKDKENEVGNELVLRYRFRSELLDQAIHKHRRRYTPVPDKVVGDFNANYVALLSSVAPEIIPGNSMMKPANPRESTSMIFDQAKSLDQLPLHIRPRRFAHELGRGSERRANYVAITFAGWGKALPFIKDQLETDTARLGACFDSKKATKTRPNPGLVMSIPTAPVDNQGSFTEQSVKLTEGIEVAANLRRWLISNTDILQKWHDLVNEHVKGAG